jgi:hypothetical protein
VNNIPTSDGCKVHLIGSPNSRDETFTTLTAGRGQKGANRTQLDTSAIATIMFSGWELLATVSDKQHHRSLSPATLIF